MYKKCDIIKNEVKQDYLFEYEADKKIQLLMKREVLITKDLFQEIIKKEIDKRNEYLDEKISEELKKFNIITRKPAYIKMWLTRKKLEVRLTLTDDLPKIEIAKKEKSNG